MVSANRLICCLPRLGYVVMGGRKRENNEIYVYLNYNGRVFKFGSVGFICFFASSLLILHLRAFVKFYTLVSSLASLFLFSYPVLICDTQGNMLVLSSTFFLVGPTTQCKSLLQPARFIGFLLFSIPPLRLTSFFSKPFSYTSVRWLPRSTSPSPSTAAALPSFVCAFRCSPPCGMAQATSPMLSLVYGTPRGASFQCKGVGACLIVRLIHFSSVGMVWSVQAGVNYLVL